MRTFAIDLSTSGFDLHTVGIILMVARFLGLAVSALLWSSFSPWSRRRSVVSRQGVIEVRRIERKLP